MRELCEIPAGFKTGTAASKSPTPAEIQGVIGDALERVAFSPEQILDLIKRRVSNASPEQLLLAAIAELIDRAEQDAELDDLEERIDELESRCASLETEADELREALAENREAAREVES